MRNPYRRHAAAVSIVCLALGVAANAAMAHGAKLGEIQIGHLWAKPPAGDTIEVFGPLLNMGKQPDRLVAASSPIARAVRFEVKKDGSMHQVASVELSSGQPVSLAPWREHIVLEGLETKPQPNSMVPLTLSFERAGKIVVDVVIEQKPGD